MRIVLFLILFVQGVVAQTEVKFNDIPKEYLEKFRVEKDDFENYYIIAPDKNAFMKSSRFRPYLLLKNDKLYFYIQFIYNSNSWLFIDSILLKHDNEVFEIPIHNPNQSVSSSATISEAVDVLVDQELFNFLNKVQSKKDKFEIRFKGSSGNSRFKLYKPEVKLLTKTLDLLNKISTN